MPDKKKIFVRGIFKEKVFDNGGVIIKCAINLDELYKHADEKGMVRFDIKRKRECGEDGKSHYGEIDTWKPTQNDDDDKLPF